METSGGAEQAEIAELIARTTEVVDDWLGLDADALSVGQLADLLAIHARESARLEGASLDLDASFARRKGYAASGHNSHQHWLQNELRLSPTAAMRRARTARELDDNLEATREALRDGEISGDHAAAIAEAARKLPKDAAAEATLLGVARDGDARQVRNTGRRLEHRHDEEAARRRARRAWDLRNLSINHGADGVTWVHGRLHQWAGEQLSAAIDHLAAPAGPDDDRTPGQRRADALTEIARRQVKAADGGTDGGADDGGGSAGRGGGEMIDPRRAAAQLVALVPLDEVERRAGRAPGSLGPGNLDWTGPMPPQAFTEALCESGLDWLVTDSRGLPLHYGRSKRFVQRHQRTALYVRDGGCRFPGCTAKHRWTVAHHVIYWDDGGRTDITVLVSLCQSHHSYIHHGGWTLELHDDACVTVRSPGGTIVRSESAARARARHLHGEGLDAGSPLDCPEHAVAEVQMPSRDHGRLRSADPVSLRTERRDEGRRPSTGRESTPDATADQRRLAAQPLLADQPRLADQPLLADQPRPIDPHIAHRAASVQIRLPKRVRLGFRADLGADLGPGRTSGAVPGRIADLLPHASAASTSNVVRRGSRRALGPPRDPRPGSRSGSRAPLRSRRPTGRSPPI